MTLAFKKNGAGDATAITATTDVGTYRFYLSMIAEEDASNYNFSFLINDDEDAYIAIEQRELTVDWSANGEKTDDHFVLVYNGTYQRPAASLVGVLEADLADVEYEWDEKFVAHKDVWNGVQKVWIKEALAGTKGGNYKFASTAVLDSDFSLAPKPITVQWGETTAFTYTGAGQAPTVVGITGGSIVAGDAENVILVEPTTETNANTTQNPSYTATVSLSGAKAANYTITNNTCDFTIAPYGVTPALYIDDNLVEGDNGSVTYDGNNHVFVIKATGLNEDEVIFYTSVNDEHINVFNDGTGYSAGYRVRATGNLNLNYAAAADCDFTWAITARPLSLNWALEANGDYSGAEFPGYKTFTFVYNGTVQHPVADLQNVVGDEDVEIVYPAGIKNAITNGGYHAYEIVSLKGNAKNNYVWADNAEKKVYFDMKAKPITVTIEAKESVYGEERVDLTATPEEDAIVEGDATPYYTNSSHLPVGFTSDIFDALDIQDDLQTLYTSGTVFHAFLGQKLDNWQAAANLVRKIAENYKLPYYTMSPTYSICADHGYLAGDQRKCPICGRTTEVYSRITGYYRPIANWNDGKSEEFKMRKTYDIAHSVFKAGNKEDAKAEGAVAAKAQQAAAEGMLLFTTKTCPNCKMSKMMLDKAGIGYTPIDAEDQKDQTVKMGIRKAPTLLVPNGNGGYDRYENASEIKGFIEGVRK